MSGFFGTPLAGPIILAVKNVTIKTTGSPADIATITVPAGITKYRVLGSSAATMPAVAMIPNTFSATMAAATFQLNDAAANGGQNLTQTGTGPGTSAQSTGIAAGNNTFATASTLYIRQTVDSANAGTLDFYVMLYPTL